MFISMGIVLTIVQIVNSQRVHILDILKNMEMGNSECGKQMEEFILNIFIEEWATRSK